MKYIILLLSVFLISCSLQESNDPIDDPLNGSWIRLVDNNTLFTSGWKTNSNDIVILQRRKFGIDYTRIYKYYSFDRYFETNNYYFTYKESSYIEGVKIDYFERKIKLFEIMGKEFIITQTLKCFIYNDDLYIDIDSDKSLITLATIVDLIDGFDRYIKKKNNDI